jgi:hypothetical protein
MSAPNEQLFKRWGHSFEEDHDDVVVYRPADFDFPRARGRDGIEFQPDGTYIDWVVGRGDAREPRPGQWRLEGDGRLRLTTADGQERVVEVGQLTPDRLELRTGSGP